MKKSLFIFLSLACGFFGVQTASAESLALTCGDDIEIYSQFEVVGLHHSQGRGQIFNEDMELGEVSVVRGNSTVILNKTAGSVRGFGGLGKKRGFGLYETRFFYRLDLRNTFGNYDIYLQDLYNGKIVKCKKPAGDCC